MTETKSRASIELKLDRTFDAPRALVFENWISADHLPAWFAPDVFEVIECAVDARVGGRFRIVYRSPSGERYVEHGEFLDIVAPERLRLTLINEDERGRVNFRTEVSVHFQELGDRTLMKFEQTGLEGPAAADIEQGWNSCFSKLGRQVESERELGALFAAWFDASERKDLEASMAPIDPTVVSYEHEAPLVHRGVEALRAQCKKGFERAPERFRWDVPELRVIVRGDIAVTWGLNHMYGSGHESWSRGTRVFQRIGGNWRLIHQHVSFPVDPNSGAARTDLSPSTD